MYHFRQDELDKLLSQHQQYVNSFSKTGKKIQINKFNLSNYIFKNLSLTDSFITESLFCDNMFENVEIYDANLCGCEFNNTMFRDVNFVKTDMSYCVFKNCKFINTKVNRCEMYETSFEYTQFISCSLYDVFAFSSLKDVMFYDMNLGCLEFYETMVENIKIKNDEEFDISKAVKSLNIGDFKNNNIITGENAIKYFQKVCTYI